MRSVYKPKDIISPYNTMAVKVVTSEKLRDIKGVETEMTVGTFLAEVLWNSRENQARSYILAKKFAIEPEVELKAEDVVFIQKVMTTLGARAGEAGQVSVLLDGDTEKK